MKSQGIARTRVLPDQEKEVSKNKQRTKNKNYKSSWSPLPSFGFSFRLGITRGTYGVGRGLLTCVTAPLSADFPTPMLYPTVQPSSQALREQGSVVNKNAKTKETLSAIKFKNNEPNEIIKSQIRFLQSRVAGALMEHITLKTLKRSPDKIKLCAAFKSLVTNSG